MVSLIFEIGLVFTVHAVCKLGSYDALILCKWHVCFGCDKLFHWTTVSLHWFFFFFSFKSAMDLFFSITHLVFVFFLTTLFSYFFKLQWKLENKINSFKMNIRTMVLLGCGVTGDFFWRMKRYHSPNSHQKIWRTDSLKTHVLLGVISDIHIP